jgi:hypothetical protein
MYTLRCTAVLLRRLQHLTPAGSGPEPVPTTALGDWYANRLNLGRHRLILCTNERSLLSVVVPAKDLPQLPDRLVTSAGRLFTRIGVPPALAWAELQAMQEVRFGPTRSRSVLGSMNDFVYQVDAEFSEGEDVVYLDEVDLRLSEVPCGPLKYRNPAEVALDLMTRAA